MITMEQWRTTATYRPRPPAPELVPGLPAENLRRLQIYRELLMSWKAERAERLMSGMSI